MRRASAEIRPELVDRMMDLYCDWRAECAAVQAAYERFCDAVAPDRAVAFAAYGAALDREQTACACYAAQVRLIESHCAARRPHFKLGGSAAQALAEPEA